LEVVFDLDLRERLGEAASECGESGAFLVGDDENTPAGEGEGTANEPDEGGRAAPGAPEIADHQEWMVPPRPPDLTAGVKRVPLSSVTENIAKPKAHAGEMGMPAALQRGTVDASEGPSERWAGWVLRQSLPIWVDGLAGWSTVS